MTQRALRTAYVTLNEIRKKIKGSKAQMRNQRHTKWITVLFSVTQLRLLIAVMADRKTKCSVGATTVTTTSGKQSRSYLKRQKRDGGRKQLNCR